jgi:hypothetical protein
MTMTTKTMMIEMMIEIAKKYPVADRDGFDTELRAMNTQNEDCDDCKVSKMNEGGDAFDKFKHLLLQHLHDTWACQQDGYENECDEFNLRNEEPTDVPPTFRGACADCGQIETECCLKLKGGKVMCCDCLYPEAPEEEEEEEETDDE